MYLAFSLNVSVVNRLCVDEAKQSLKTLKHLSSSDQKAAHPNAAPST